MLVSRFFLKGGAGNAGSGVKAEKATDTAPREAGTQSPPTGRCIGSFSALTPEPAFPAPPFRKNRLTNIQFLFIWNDYAEIDFWLDDLSFYVDP